MQRLILLLCAALCAGYYVPALLRAESTAPAGESGFSKQACSESTITIEDKTYLLTLAREAIARYLEHKERLAVPAEKRSANLIRAKGCFVTLTTSHGELRGCIGHILPQESLCDCVVENAINAAVHDYRFPPLQTGEELKKLSIEISVLSIPEKCSAAGPEQLLNVLVPDQDGVIVRRGLRQSTYLPQVWEHFPDKKDFLGSLCRKGGMASDCWQEPETEILIYRAEVFREGNE